MMLASVMMVVAICLLGAGRMPVRTVALLDEHAIAIRQLAAEPSLDAAKATVSTARSR
jgi:hypothetical protein